MSEVLVNVTRGSLVESFHRGHIVVSDAQGNIVYALGDPEYVTFMRSSAKPLQALAVVESGAIDALGLTTEDLAIICGSHAGQPVHTELVVSILAKAGLSPDVLMCGAHRPFHAPTANALTEAGLKPNSLHNNCSGKHSGMLVLSVHRKWPVENYIEVTHQVQQLMLTTVAEMCGFSRENIVIGIDGCGVPVFGMPLRNMAAGYARLTNPQVLNADRENACRRVTQAMMDNPQLVSGDGRICTEIMSVAPQKVVSKMGAEAVYCFGLPGTGLGVAIKLEDGGQRGLEPAVIETMAQLGVFDEQGLQQLVGFHHPLVKNFRGDIVGKIEAVFHLKNSGSACIS
ncbi:MAG: asparaginase [Bacillota bacterium]